MHPIRPSSWQLAPLALALLLTAVVAPRGHAQCEVDLLLAGPPTAADIDSHSGDVVLTEVDGKTRLLTWTRRAGENHSIQLYERAPGSPYVPLASWDAGTTDELLRLAMDGPVVAWSSVDPPSVYVAVQDDVGSWSQPAVPDLALVGDVLFPLAVHWVDWNDSFTMVVGEPDTLDVGWVHQLRGDGNGIVHSTSFPAPFGASVDDLYGFSLGLTEGTLAVGAPRGDIGANAGGQVYLYRRLADSSEDDPVFGWNIAYFGQSGFSFFGRQIDADGNHVVVGSRFDDTAANNAGAVDFFTWNGSAFVPSGSDVGDVTGDGFGVSVTVSGTRAVAGYANVDVVQVYTYSDFSWSSSQTLAPSQMSETFGRQASLSGDRLAIGAPESQIAGAAHPGAIHGFLFDGLGEVVSEPDYTLIGNPQEVPTLTASGPLCGGGTLGVQGSSIAGGSTSFLFVGDGILAAPFRGGTLYTNDTLGILIFPTSSGFFSIDIPIPPNLPTVTVYLQAWTIDAAAPLGASATNGLAVTIDS